MGRPRKTIDELIASGTFRPSRHGDRLEATDQPACETPVETGETPSTIKRPAGLAPDVAGQWDRLVSILAGRVKPQDAIQLVEMSHWLAEVNRGRDALRKAEPGTLAHGRLIRSVQAAAGSFDRIAIRFGLTPKDRARLPLRESDGEKPRAKVRTRQPTAFDRQGASK